MPGKMVVARSKGAAPPEEVVTLRDVAIALDERRGLISLALGGRTSVWKGVSMDDTFKWHDALLSAVAECAPCHPPPPFPFSCVFQAPLHTGADTTLWTQRTLAWCFQPQRGLLMPHAGPPQRLYVWLATRRVLRAGRSARGSVQASGPKDSRRGSARWASTRTPRSASARAATPSSPPPPAAAAPAAARASRRMPTPTRCPPPSWPRVAARCALMPLMPVPCRRRDALP
jgi:hypothetical protein